MPSLTYLIRLETELNILEEEEWVLREMKRTNTLAKNYEWLIQTNIDMQIDTQRKIKGCLA